MKAKEFIEKYSDWVSIIIHDGDTVELARFIDRYLDDYLKGLHLDAAGYDILYKDGDKSK